jgi:DNA processing protein
VRDAAERALSFARGTPRYPPALADLSDAPERVYLRGRLPQGPMVAIVGSRAATPYGIGIARRLAADLARLGIPVVSGLARGIDAAAHGGALEAGGLTVAVIPAGLDTITPVHHRALAERIAGQGALLSEIESGGPRFRGQFVERNRLIAALADATVVVEAAESSGALTTAHFARRLGRELLAVPGDVGRPTAHGCHQLLRAGAALCENAADVVSALERGAARAAAPRVSQSPRFIEAGTRQRARPAPRQPQLDLESNSAGARLLAVLGSEPATLDALAAASGLEPAAALAALAPLEWAGLARAAAGARWMRGSR